MIKIGKTNSLRVAASLPFGYHLTSDNPNDPLVLLPHAQVSTPLKDGDVLSVFVGTDETGNLQGWTTPPVAEVGDTLVLKAVGSTHFGGFFDWGLDKDLLVPAGMQESPVNQGFNYVVHIYYDDKTNRILGATKLHHFLSETNTEHQVGDTVQCLVYAKTELGFKVVINRTNLGLIFHSDAFKKLSIGQEVEGYIKVIREDGKIDVALQRTDKIGRSNLESAILEDLDAYGGVSTLTDKSKPEDIYAHFNVSKAAYKKALGALYKKRLITIDKDTIRLNK
ncbi:S1 RNA-binding domain-containing protein [Aestuariibacter sp. A3R04]|uniref:CvfB family protein n=1 Tax=Aestuariibacter sp. A3R04 TaxID=2841571 RepID=UPI001C081505|nr:S1-like domain-containing RNA-binding protein [Aestuariibacter sp. A3R04]MBU3022743.1 hypothetical protein [Aestuariibacter sp. A3R04]